MENIKEDFELRNMQFKDAVASCKDRRGDNLYHQPHRHKNDGREKTKKKKLVGIQLQPPTAVWTGIPYTG